MKIDFIETASTATTKKRALGPKPSPDIKALRNRKPGSVPKTVMALNNSPADMYDIRSKRAE